MTSTLAPDFSQPPLSRALRGSGPSPASLRAAAERIHVLSVDWHSLRGAASTGLCVSTDEQRTWLTLAAREGASLVVMSTDERLELFSTERDRKRAFRAVMESLAACVKERPELGKARTVTRMGGDAVRHLFARVAGIEPSGTRPFVAHMHAASTASSAMAALGPTLASLFRNAANVGRRVRLEALISDPLQSLDDLEALSAERIVEEELAAWQTQEAELCRAEDFAEQFSIEPDGEETRDSRVFMGDEPGSHVRIRVGDFIAPDTLPASLRVVGQRR